MSYVGPTEVMGRDTACQQLARDDGGGRAHITNDDNPASGQAGIWRLPDELTDFFQLLDIWHQGRN